MEYIPPNPVLQYRPGTLQKVRKICDLDNPERLKEALDLFEEWVNKQSHFVKRDFSRKYLERSLIICKGSLEKAKKQLDRLCTAKTVLPQFFTKTNVKKELEYLTTLALLLPLPNMTDDFYRVAIVNIKPKEFRSHHFMEYIQYCFILFEYLKQHDYANGYIIVDDFRNISITDLLTKINSVVVQQATNIAIEAYGARVKGIYLLSDSKAIDMLVKFIKQFLTPKISNRIHVITRIEELKNYIPKEILPEEYGGTDKSMETLTREWVDTLSTEEHVSYMEMMNKACTDESLRQIGQFNEDYMGMPGSFRHLSVD